MALQRGEKKSFKWSSEGATPEEGKWSPEKEEEEENGEAGRKWRMEIAKAGKVDGKRERGRDGDGKDGWKERGKDRQEGGRAEEKMDGKK